MSWEMRHVLEVVPRKDYTLLLTFDNGEKRIWNAQQKFRADKPHPLSDINFFMRAHVEDGAVAWSENYEACPDALYRNSAPCQKDVSG
jgi:hypothetical protein